MESEYDHCYKADQQLDCSVNAYRNNLAFRNRLRSRSQGHDNYPFIWDDSNKSDDDTTSGRTTASSQNDTAHHHPRYGNEPRGCIKDKSSQTDLEYNPDTQECACETEPDAEFMNNDEDFVNSPKREIQAPTGCYWHEKLPYALYGSRDEESEIGCKKTFNIRASKESALRAMRRRKKHDLDRSFEQVKRVQSLPSLLNSKRHKEVASWETEYERAYKAPDPSSYQDVCCNKPMHVLSPDLIPSSPRKHHSYLSVD